MIISFFVYWINLWMNLLYSIINFPINFLFGTRKITLTRKTVSSQGNLPPSSSNSTPPLVSKLQQEVQEQQHKQQELQKSLLLTQLDTLRDQVQGIRLQLEGNNAIINERYHYNFSLFHYLII